MWDKDEGDVAPDLGLRIVGNITEFMKNSKFCDKFGEYKGSTNCFEVVTLWQNERKRGVPKK